jgi:LacI family transcriptional regulator
VKHPYRIREIAAQAGLSQATVDRVLHARGGVRESTVREVDRPSPTWTGSSRPGAPRRPDLHDRRGRAGAARFSAAVRHALEAELPALRPAVIRSRFHFFDSPAVGDLVGGLDRVAARARTA